MHLPLLSFGSATPLLRAVRLWSLLPLVHACALAQGGVRPGDGGGGGVVIPPGGGGGGGGVVVPPGGGGGGGIINPGGGGGAATGLRIVTDTGILAGAASQATIVVPNTAGQGGTPTAQSSTYQWTISGGRFTSGTTAQLVTFIADTAGTVSLNVVVSSAGAAQSTSIDVAVISPALAGAISAAATIVTNTTTGTLTASVPAAVGNDRTFRWTVAGNAAAITAGQGTNTVTVRPGQPGLLEVICDVNLQQLATVNLRSFVVVAGSGAPAPVTVSGGTGSGTYPAGSRIDVAALPPGPGQVFDRWTGDTAMLGAAAISPLLPQAVITVPAAGGTLTATYRPAPAWTPTVVTGFNPLTQASPSGTTLTYHLPADAQGLVFLLHEGGGSGADWFTLPEPALLVRDLVAAGYGVAALSSANRNTGAWSQQAALANNADAATHVAALDRFARDHGFAATKPVFFLGLAAGGDAALRYADLLATAATPRNVKGAVLYGATGGGTLAVTSRVPQFFAIASHDEVLGPTGNAEIRANNQLLTGRGIATGLVNNPTTPVNAGRLRMLAVTNPAFTAADAQAVYTAIKSAALVDANDYPKGVATVDAVRAALPATYQPRAVEVQTQLAVGYGGREFYASANPRVINFLNARAADNPVPAPGRLINLSTRSRVAFLGDSFALGFSISGTQRATLLIRGIGPALARFGVPGALSTARLELYRGSSVIASNDGWDLPGGATTPAQMIAAAASVGAFPLTAGDLDTALLVQLDPGTYSATIKGLNGATGEVLAEIYDVSRNATRLTNLSTLARINNEGDTLVPGIVIAGNNPRALVIRAVAQGLVDFGLPATSLLGDARISVLTNVQNAGQTVTQTVATNNNWAQAGAAALNAAFPAVGAFPLRTASDAALLEALAPGAYSLRADAAPSVNGPNGQPPAVLPNLTGSVLVDVYELP
ncbi:MAG: hypothetical protein Q8N18_11505 [Opitutaceae bacterium]|nr:hypothetical protein [Opitutaceae bacterium]